MVDRSQHRYQPTSPGGKARHRVSEVPPRPCSHENEAIGETQAVRNRLLEMIMRNEASRKTKPQ